MIKRCCQNFVEIGFYDITIADPDEMLYFVYSCKDK